MVDKLPTEKKLHSPSSVTIVPRLDQGNSSQIQAFLEQPVSTIVAGLTSAVAEGSSGLVGIAGRLLQGALQGKALKQLGCELNRLVESGKIPEDYADRPYVAESLAESFRLIDEEVIDADRLLAIQAMLYAVATAGDEAGDQMVAYELFHVTKRLTSVQLLVLRFTYDVKEDLKTSGVTGHEGWLQLVSVKMGHKITSFVENAEKVLVEEGLLTGRTYSDRSGISPRNGRLTDLGDRLCETILSYPKV